MFERSQRAPQGEDRPPPFMDGGDGGLPLKAMAASFLTLLLFTLAAAGLMRAVEREQPASRGQSGNTAHGAPQPVLGAVPPGQRVREKGKLRIVTGAREQRGRLTVIFPRQIGRWDVLPFVVRGTSAPAPQQSGSAWIAIYLAHVPCPERRPAPDAPGVHAGPAFMVYADAPFHGAGNQPLRELRARRLNVCGYLAENSTKPPVPGPELLVASSVELLDQPRRALAAGEGFLEPGRYRAEGKAVRGAGGAASVEFEVIEAAVPGRLRTLGKLQASRLAPRRCEADGAVMPSEVGLAFGQPVVGDTFDATNPTAGVALTGGTAEGRKARGQVFVDYGGCTAAIRFVATRVR